jgi:hypothetical protein
MSDFIWQLKKVVEAMSIRSTTGFTWFGKPSPALPPRITRALNPSTARSYLLFALQSTLYSNFYCKGQAAPADGANSGLTAVGESAFVRALSAANTGKGYWSEGWRAASLSAGRGTALVGKDGLHIVAKLADCLAEEDHPAEGAMVKVRFGKELLRISPGYYMALSDRELSRERPGPMVRFYWNVSPVGAIRLLKEATTRLNSANIPFRLKAINDPVHYTRCDAAILYVGAAEFDPVQSIVSDVYGEIAGLMRPATPVLTLQVAPGLGFAEGPLDGQSFGLSRCRMIADGLITAFEEGKRTSQERLGAVIERFAREGISLERPYLNRGSTRSYAIARPIDIRSRQHMPSAPAGEVPRLEPGEYLRTAEGIAREICEAAVWYEGRCNWLGALATPPRSGRAVRSLGPDLYDGTAGIAIFLAELFRITGDKELRRTARGAIAQAFAGVEAVPPAVRLGLYTGWTGIALAGARVGRLLGEEEWPAHTLALLGRLHEAIVGEQEFGLLSGRAGAVAGLVALSICLGEPRLVEVAVDIADDLIEGAERSEAGCSWPSIQVSSRRNLTGYSHGAAGIGYALLELYRVSSNTRYRDLAREAFDYERYWFDEEHRNWPDFREAIDSTPGGRSAPRTSRAPAGGRARGAHRYSYPAFWCHGAAGIALSRLGASSILDDPIFLSEAETAIATTAQATEAALSSGLDNYSLCHGLAGNADILLCAGEMQRSSQEFTDGLAHRVATAGILLHSSADNPWPSGVTGGGETPSLMLGLAGTGYFYLRMYSPDVPSVLWLRSELLA